MENKELDCLWKNASVTITGTSKALLCVFENSDFVKIIKSTIKDFVWNGKKPKIKYNTLIGDYCAGGLKLPDFDSVLKANRVKRAVNLIYSDESNMSTTIPSLYLESIGGASKYMRILTLLEYQKICLCFIKKYYYLGRNLQMKIHGRTRHLYGINIFGIIGT